MREAVPTGRWRHRIWRGRMVLQIEERGMVTEMFGPWPDTNHVNRWRDARPEDVTVADKP